jgi:hypothetical protein
MNEEKTVAATANAAEASAANPTYPTLDAVVAEAVKFVESLGKAIATTVQDASEVMVVNVDKDTREQLDLLVDAGVVDSRREAASSLIKEGLKSREGVFGKIHATKAQIAELRQQIRAAVSRQN